MWPITSAIIIIVLASALAYVIYLANQWSVYGKEVNAHAHTMGVEIAQLESELSSAENQLDAAQEQLSTAQSRITELASEKALVGDDRETQRLLAEDTAAIATEALGVSSDLASCVTRQTRVLNAVSSIQSTQNDLLTERSKPSKDQDSEVLAQLDESLQEEQNKLTKASEVAEETCQGATERYTTLVEDLES
ncbi:hypothetical protein [Jonesia quinghaiensis]|uniref:hypothetical protein n=1 Tax=Jonesia quinghaiensis TaxID=262806 RepID=UPI0012F7135B|nr:hypothetical protein [Jonesia quinghaiensis]